MSRKHSGKRSSVSRMLSGLSSTSFKSPSGDFFCFYGFGRHSEKDRRIDSVKLLRFRVSWRVAFPFHILSGKLGYTVL